MADIKLFVCCHQPTEVPKHPLLVPIQVGTALADQRFPGFLYDDTGENISDKNRSYCELTAQYWTWKNVDADYYGFFHYRRYLYPDGKAKRPYRIEKRPQAALLDKLGYKNFADIIQQYDLILPIGENMYIPVREHYARASFHHRKDLKLVEEIIKKYSPKYVSAMEEYLSGTFCYFGNIFIMRKAIFQDYCKWLFPILAEFDKRADFNSYNPQEIRVDGYLAERLLGIYCSCCKSKLNVLELPRVHFHSKTDFLWKNVVNTFLPPSTRCRAYIKEIIRASATKVKKL